VGEAFSQAEQAGGTQVAFPAMMEPSAVGARVLKAVQDDELYIITHGEWRPGAEQRHAAILAAMPEKIDPALAAWIQGPRNR
jgi:hypothetical protein